MLPITSAALSSIEILLSDTPGALGQPDPKSCEEIIQLLVDVKPEQITDRDLRPLSPHEIQTIASTVEQMLAAFQELARQLASNPRTKIPSQYRHLHIPSVHFDYEKFRDGPLARAFERVRTAERRAKGPSLARPWMKAALEALAGLEVRDVLIGMMPVAIRLILDDLGIRDYPADHEKPFTRMGAMRFGFLDFIAAETLVFREVPRGKSAADLEKLMFFRTLDQIVADRTIVPHYIAQKLLTAGKGDPDNAAPLISKLVAVDKELTTGVAYVDGERDGGGFGISPKSAKANALYANLLSLSDPEQNPDSVYKCYRAFISKENVGRW